MATVHHRSGVDAIEQADAHASLSAASFGAVKSLLLELLLVLAYAVLLVLTPFVLAVMAVMRFVKMRKREAAPATPRS